MLYASPFNETPESTKDIPSLTPGPTHPKKQQLRVEAMRAASRIVVELEARRAWAGGEPPDMRGLLFSYARDIEKYLEGG